ncbi:MAG: hypothetical protein H0U57_00220 [Tatlockia sp.]|nr:hypothetical protein [Tatlockia sp.]
MAINLETNQAVACFTNSANGPTIYKQIAKPIVGNLEVAYQWLFTREGYNQEKAKEYKESLDDLKDLELKENINSSIIPK